MKQEKEVPLSDNSFQTVTEVFDRVEIIELLFWPGSSPDLNRRKLEAPFGNSFPNEVLRNKESIEDVIVSWHQNVGSNPGEGMGGYKCILSARPESTLNSRQAASLLVRSVEGGGRSLTIPTVFSLKIGVETSQIIQSTC
ncbi:hypothetical protein TNCV_1235951 [Trichonephila clavipes]|nr:hypothetical protein TNCV_1235951 [Trichonephila clavipes]